MRLLAQHVHRYRQRGPLEQACQTRGPWAACLVNTRLTCLLQREGGSRLGGGARASREHVRPPVPGPEPGSSAGGVDLGSTAQTLKTTCPSTYNCGPMSAPETLTGRERDLGSATCPHGLLKLSGKTKALEKLPLNLNLCNHSYL